VHAIVQHPMDTGFFRTVDGQPIPAWFIQDVVVTYAGQQVAKFTWTSGVSRDPVVSFNLLADREGPLTMTWTDNKGSVFEATAQIAFSTT
jgi:sulfur-oxidizing protein SoxZ